jgi:hypothetical protein
MLIQRVGLSSHFLEIIFFLFFLCCVSINIYVLAYPSDESFLIQGHLETSNEHEEFARIE